MSHQDLTILLCNLQNSSTFPTNYYFTWLLIIYCLYYCKTSLTDFQTPSVKVSLVFYGCSVKMRFLQRKCDKECETEWSWEARGGILCPRAWDCGSQEETYLTFPIGKSLLYSFNRRREEFLLGTATNSDNKNTTTQPMRNHHPWLLYFL